MGMHWLRVSIVTAYALLVARRRSNARTAGACETPRFAMPQTLRPPQSATLGQPPEEAETALGRAARAKL